MQDEKTGHTPGPWRQVGVNVYAGEREPGSSGDLICQCQVTLEGKANARLMAAAPKMETFIDLLWQLLNQFSDGRHVNWDSMKQEAEKILGQIRGEK